jgi:hypothetical protein
MGEAGAAFAVTNDYNQTSLILAVLVMQQNTLTFHCVTSTILILENEQ